MILEKRKAFNQFAPAILRVYHRDKEAFWSAIMAPFLADKVSLWDWFHHLQVDIGLLAAFKSLDKDAQEELKEFSAPLGLDVTSWKSNRLQYFKDAYPVFAFLVVWMDEMGLVDLIDQFSGILCAGIYAVAGYGILDENVDSDSPSPVEILTAQALIAEYELRALHIFGVSEVNLKILHQMRTLFLNAEIKEKVMRHKGSPYRLDDPTALGAKGANAVTPFMLSLERLGKATLIDDYWKVFLLFGAAIQMIDDWTDLEKDLTAGHYSYITLGSETMYGIHDPKEAARLLREDRKLVLTTHVRSKEMIGKARAILTRLKDPYLMRLVDVTELRLDSYFRKEFNL